MNKYLFNARDIAAYMKWFSVPSHLEVTYMQYFFSIGNKIIAEPLTRDFESFKNEIYRELYYLWANGFEDDKSDISKMNINGALSLICDQECVNLESYMKLITLHLIFSKYLPYVKVNFYGIPWTLGIECDMEVFEKNVLMAMEGLNLTCKDVFGNPFDIKLGVPDELLCVSLNDEFKKLLADEEDFRMLLRNKESEHMKQLKAKSLEVFKPMNNELMDKVSKPSSRSSKKSVNKVSKQPKGAPLK
ncbi:MAG: hypothetical protein MJ166_00760 [Clostridia bacterium]|nr:hypothetical protein [Clostridia bacterium]